MKTSLLIIFILTIIWVVNPLVTSAQDPDKSSENYILSDKQAKSQTKAMVMLLNLNEPVRIDVYKINLKYQLLTNSLRLGTTPIAEKIEMHANIDEQKNAELKSTLTAEQYHKYILLLENAKTQLNTRVKR